MTCKPCKKTYKVELISKLMIVYFIQINVTHCVCKIVAAILRRKRRSIIFSLSPFFWTLNSIGLLVEITINSCIIEMLGKYDSEKVNRTNKIQHEQGAQ